MDGTLDRSGRVVVPEDPKARSASVAKLLSTGILESKGQRLGNPPGAGEAIGFCRNSIAPTQPDTWESLDLKGEIRIVDWSGLELTERTVPI
jgi:hypothetical protein